MKNYQLVIGIDVSKSKLDACFVRPSETAHSKYVCLNNTKKGVQQMVKEINKLKVSVEEVFICFENTGAYSMPLCYYLSDLGIDYSMVSALEIKRSLGIKRGKSDKADAKAIAEYAVSHYRKLPLSTLPERLIMELKVLISEREKIVKSLKQFKQSSEHTSFLPKEVTREAMRINKKTVNMLTKRLEEIDKVMKNKIDNDQEMKQCYTLCCSVPGVGQQTAVNLIVTTGMFTKFTSWRKLACYSGIAPFEYSSGSSIRGKTRVNDIADKKLKSLLNMSALAAKRYDKELAAYYKRKVAEGKNKMSVLNAIRCKVLSRVFATVQRGTPYVDTYKFAG